MQQGGKVEKTKFIQVATLQFALFSIKTREIIDREELLLMRE